MSTSWFIVAAASVVASPYDFRLMSGRSSAPYLRVRVQSKVCQKVDRLRRPGVRVVGGRGEGRGPVVRPEGRRGEGEGEEGADHAACHGRDYKPFRPNGKVKQVVHTRPSSVAHLRMDCAGRTCSRLAPAARAPTALASVARHRDPARTDPTALQSREREPPACETERARDAAARLSSRTLVIRALAGARTEQSAPFSRSRSSRRAAASDPDRAASSARPNRCAWSSTLTPCPNCSNI